MNAFINNIVGYIISHYPFPDDLSKARLNKIVYLIDWKFCLNYNKQATDIRWIFNHYGPFVDEIETSLKSENDRFIFIDSSTIFGSKKCVIALAQPSLEDESLLENNVKKVIDFIINLTKDMPWNKFINTVYSTYPIQVSERGTTLNLIMLANEYILKNKNN